MVNRLSDADNRLLRAWRLGELDAQRAQSFEERLFFDPALSEAANIDMALEAGLRDTLRPEPLHAPRQPATRRRRRMVELLAAAAIGALAVVPFTAAPPTSQPVSSNIEWVSLSARRDLQAEPQLVAPRAGAELITLEVAVAAADGDAVSVRLDGAHGGTLLQADRLQVRDGAVTLAFARDALPPGVLSVEVIGSSGQRQQAPLLIRYQPR
jgi:hypothetical protein